MSKGSLTDSKSAKITVLQVSSSSGNSSGSNGGGSSGGSSSGRSGVPSELASNVIAKEISQMFIASRNYVKFDFPKNAIPVVNLSFDAKKTTGKTTTTVELLKGKSTLVSNLPFDEVYKFFNVWVGSSGFITSKNIENATVCMKVEKSWLQDQNIDQFSITLNRYSDGKWNPLFINLSGEDDKYLYFTAKTPGFSPFGITGKTTAKVAVTKTQPEPNTGTTVANVEQTPVKTENPNTSGKGSTKAPGFEAVCVVVSLLVVFLNKRK